MQPSRIFGPLSTDPDRQANGYDTTGERIAKNPILMTRTPKRQRKSFCAVLAARSFHWRRSSGEQHHLSQIVNPVGNSKFSDWDFDPKLPQTTKAVFGSAGMFVAPQHTARTQERRSATLERKHNGTNYSPKPRRIPRITTSQTEWQPRFSFANGGGPRGSVSTYAVRK